MEQVDSNIMVDIESDGSLTRSVGDLHESSIIAVKTNKPLNTLIKPAFTNISFRTGVLLYKTVK